MIVLGDVPEPELLEVNHPDDRFSVSPALAGDAILLSGEESLDSLAAPLRRVSPLLHPEKRDALEPSWVVIRPSDS